MDINDLTIVLANYGQTLRAGHQRRSGAVHRRPSARLGRLPARLRLATATVRRSLARAVRSRDYQR